MVDVEDDASARARANAMPALVFAGPFRKPSASWSPGPIHALMVSFYPDALARLWGIRLQDYVDTVIPADKVLPAEAVPALLSAGTSNAPLEALEALLAPLWHDAQQATGVMAIRSWLTTLTARGVHTPNGVGMRQAQRRIKRLTGQSQRDLELYARVEGAFAYAARHPDNLASIAANAGYSDQSHLGREVKRVTGLSAQQLRDKMLQDEAFWLYRVLNATARSG
ncbi:AraC family transcriptional regulator [Luteimonas sp. RIT-PG2_3]